MSFFLYFCQSFGTYTRNVHLGSSFGPPSPAWTGPYTPFRCSFHLKIGSENIKTAIKNSNWKRKLTIWKTSPEEIGPGAPYDQFDHVRNGAI